MIVREPKLKVDLTRYVEDRSSGLPRGLRGGRPKSCRRQEHNFLFDQAFDETAARSGPLAPVVNSSQHLRGRAVCLDYVPAS